METGTHRLELETLGDNQVLDLTPKIQQCVVKSGIRSGLATVFVTGSTAGISTMEYEPGLVNHDLAAAFEGIAPKNGSYVHEQTWHDDNGHAHVRATLLGPSLTVPIVDGRLTLGTWQQIILIDFDTRPRQREVIVQIMGRRREPAQ